MQHGIGVQGYRLPGVHELTLAGSQPVMLDCQPWALATDRVAIELRRVHGRIIEQQAQIATQDAAASLVQSSGHHGQGSS